MDVKIGLLVFTFLVGCIVAHLESENDLSMFFEPVNYRPRIVNGSVAAEGSHPHMVALSGGLWVRTLFCAGSLVTRRSVLTAAHCVEAAFISDSQLRNVRVIVGTNRWDSNGSVYTVTRNFTHPNYVAATIKNDIGILITCSDVVLNELVKTVPITYDFINAGVQSRVAGWGKTKSGGSVSDTLLELNVTIIEGNDCISRVAQANIDFNVTNSVPVEPHIEICTFRSTGFGICGGDSGGALTHLDNGQLIGIVSWVVHCAGGVPDVFTRVSAFQSWLGSNLV